MDIAGGKREFYGLQVLRGVAALAVVAGHSTDYLQQQNGTVPRQLAWIHGPAGVDIFFVISGFVMMISSGRLMTRAHPARLFLWRRFLRIVPLYWLLTALKLGLTVWRPQLSEHAVPSAWSAVSSFLFIPSLGPSGQIRPVIPVGWTLSFEMAFYALFAIGLTMPGRLVKFVTGAIVVVALLGVLRTDVWPAWTALADPIVLEFLAGVWLAKFAMQGKFAGRRLAAAMIALGFVGMALLSPGSNSARPLTWGVCAVSIVWGMVSLEESIASRLPRWLLLLGDASYSIYLIQTFLFPVLHIAFARWGHGLVHDHATEAGLLMILASLLMTSVAGVVVYKLVERPMTVRLRGLVGAAKPAAVTP
jgi:exopolysaccharide production protein ExoZ